MMNVQESFEQFIPFIKIDNVALTHMKLNELGDNEIDSFNIFFFHFFTKEAHISANFIQVIKSRKYNRKNIRVQDEKKLF